MAESTTDPTPARLRDYRPPAFPIDEVSMNIAFLPVSAGNNFTPKPLLPCGLRHKTLQPVAGGVTLTAPTAATNFGVNVYQMLTDKQIRNAKPKARDYTISDDTRTRSTGRLVMRVRANGTKEWLFVYWRLQDGRSKRRTIKIGTYPTLTLADARGAASELSRLHQSGVDVRAHREAGRRQQWTDETERARRGTLADLIEAYLAWMGANGRRSTRNVRISFKRYVLGAWPALARRPAKEITPGDIRDILARMLREGVTTHTNRVRAYLHAAFAKGLLLENNPRDYLSRPIRFGLSHNPVTAVPRQANYERVGQRTLSGDELRTVWNAAVPRLGTVPGSILKLAVSSAGQRVGEFLRLKWGEVDLESRLITVPAVVSKNGRENLVPIGDMAFEVLTDLSRAAREDELVCPGRDLGKAFNITSLNRATARMCEELKVERFTTRDLRRTAKTLMGEAGLDKSIRDRLQNHAFTDVSSRHYDRYSYLPEKRAAVAKWDRYLQRLVAGESADVVEMRA